MLLHYKSSIILSINACSTAWYFKTDNVTFVLYLIRFVYYRQFLYIYTYVFCINIFKFIFNKYIFYVEQIYFSCRENVFIYTCIHIYFVNISFLNK